MVRILLPQAVGARAKRPDKGWYGFQLVGAARPVQSNLERWLPGERPRAGQTCTRGRSVLCHFGGRRYPTDSHPQQQHASLYQRAGTKKAPRFSPTGPGAPCAASYRSSALSRSTGEACALCSGVGAWKEALGTGAGPRGVGVAADSDGPSCRLSGPGRRRMRHFRHDRCGKCGRSWLGSRLLGAASVIGDASYRGRLAVSLKQG